MALTCFKEHVRFFLSTVLLAAFFLGTFITESLICLLNEKLKGLPLISVLSGNVARAISQSKIDVRLRFCPPWLSPGRTYRTPKFLIPPSIPMTQFFWGRIPDTMFGDVSLSPKDLLGKHPSNFHQTASD